MLNDFSRLENPVNPFLISLRTMWIVDADQSYDVKKGGANRNEFIALRTIKGIGVISIEGIGDISLKEGTMLLLESEKIRRYYCHENCWNFWWFEFSSEDTFGLPLYRVMDIGFIDGEKDKVLACYNIMKHNDRHSAAMASSLFSVLLCMWFKKCEDISRNSSPYEQSINEVILYMKNNLEKKITMDELAAKVGLCEKRFRQIFMEITDIQPKKYLKKLRMIAAEELLKNTSIHGYEISEKLGYSNQFHFIREFKKYYGVPPSHFRT
jgi:AraC-like DNA-binding protein